MSNTIDLFKDEYAFLSNFEPVVVFYDGLEFPSVEHAYQAAKTLDIEKRKLIQKASTAGKAKRMGNSLMLRPNWDNDRIGVMATLLLQKFERGSILAQKLLDTGGAILIEGNWWRDFYWGVCDGIGENHLGKLLMVIRDKLKEAETELL